MTTGWIALPAWRAWGEVTRMHGSVMLAFAAESQRTLAADGDEEISFASEGSRYAAYMRDYRKILERPHIFNAICLNKYYTIAEIQTRYVKFIFGIIDGIWLSSPQF